jgi:O-antigen/teichoic acid export membrane protein
VKWRVVLRNIFSNWASYLVTALIGFLLSPFVVHSLGNTGYGLWTLVLSLTGYFGLLDLGVRSSVGRFVARYLALHDDEKCNRTLSTAFAILAFGGILALLATAIVLVFFFDSFHIEPGYRFAAKVALIIAGLNMASVLPLGVFSSLLAGMERFDILSGATILGEILRAILVVACLKSGYGLITLASIALFISIAEYSTMGLFAKVLHPGLRLSLKFIDRGTLRELFGFGIYRFIWIISNQLIFYSDSVVIGIFLNPGAITYYAIAGTLVNYGRTLVSVITDALYPTATRLDAQDDSAGLRRLLIIGTQIALFVALPLCLGFIFLGKQFIALWMGREYVSSGLILMILTIPQFSGMSQYASALVLAGMAKHKILALCVLAEGIANLVLSIILVRKIGVVGVAWGTVIPDLVCTAVIIPWFTLRTVRLSAREYLLGAYLRPVLASIPIAAMGYAFSIWVRTPTWPLFATEALAMCGAFSILCYFLCLDGGQRIMISSRVLRLFRREAVIS